MLEKLLNLSGPTSLALWTALVLAVALLFSCASTPKSEIRVGIQKQLFVDDLVVDSQTNLTRRLGQVTKANDGKPLSFTRRFEDGGSTPIDVWALFASVYYDSAREKFRMWHRVSFNDRSRRQGEGATARDIGVGVDYHRGYSESDDGLHFQLVSLLQGLTTSGDTNLAVTIDEQESDPEHRYKIGYDCEGDLHAAALAHSADGIQWTPYNSGRPVTYRASDFTNQIYWDR